MVQRPKISLPLSKWDTFFEVLSAALLLTLWIIVARSYASLPDTITVHFNGKGEADGFGNKSSLLSLPIIATIIYIGMTALNRYPHVFNYSILITPQNAYSVYTTATRTLRLLKAIVVLIFVVIVVVVLQTSANDTKGPGPWLLPLLVAPVILLTGSMLYSVWRRKV